MTTNHDSEIAAWRAEWMSQAQAAAGAAATTAADFRRRAVRQQRSLRARHLAELVAALIFLAFSAVVAQRNPAGETYLWAAVVWMATLVAAAFSLWNWHILWNADVKSVSEFTSAYQSRCLAGVRAVRFGQWFLVIQIAISTPWLTLDYFRNRLSAGGFVLSIVLLALFSAAFAVMFRRYRRQITLELNELGGSQTVTEGLD